MPIEKLIMTSDFDALAKMPQEQVWPSDSQTPITYEKREFPDKEAYKNLVIVQRAIIIVNNLRSKIATVMRVSQEEKDGVTVERKTMGASVLISHSPSENLQDILDAKVDHAGIVIDDPDREAEFIAWRVAKGTRYVFQANVVATDVLSIRGGKDPDKQLQILGVQEARELLDREMERNFLDAVCFEEDTECHE